MFVDISPNMDFEHYLKALLKGTTCLKHLKLQRVRHMVFHWRLKDHVSEVFEVNKDDYCIQILLQFLC